jgi:pyruvate formate lyase activating enzyme
MTVKLDTNGTNPEMVERLIRAELIDAVYMDVKAPLEREAYSRVAGVPVSVKVITRSIDLLRSSSLEVAFRTTVIPGLVEENELQRIRDFLGDVDRYTVQPFRNVETLNPMFSRLQEFDLERFEQMKRRFEVPAPGACEHDVYASTG